MYFWNIEKGPKNGEDPYEIDLLLVKGNILKTIEIKSASKLDKHWFSPAEKLREFSQIKKYVIYTGPTEITEHWSALNFADLDRLFE